MNKFNPRTLLVDGEFYLHRVLHIPEIADLKTSLGEQTGGVYGVLHTLYLSLLKFPAVQKCIVVFDTGHSIRRMELFPEYKANRKPKPGEEEAYALSKIAFQKQKDLLLESLPLFGTRLAVLPCKEGDDILGWYAKECREDLVIATEDKDMLQLINDHVAVFQPIKDNFVSNLNFRTVTGIIKPLFLLRKAIVGDASDNIPGVPTVGATTADRLLKVAEDLTAQRKIRTLQDALVQSVGIQRDVDTRNRKRYDRILESMDVISRNLKLMDIRLEPFSGEEDSELRRVLDSSSGIFQEMKALHFLERMEFKQLTAGWAEFSRPFRSLK